MSNTIDLERDRAELAATEELLASGHWSAPTTEQLMAENRIAVLKAQIAAAEAEIAANAAAQAEHRKKVSHYPRAHRVQLDKDELARLEAQVHVDPSPLSVAQKGVIEDKIVALKAKIADEV